jgi:hypothetical protein
MIEENFGKHLRTIRYRTVDPETGRYLSQERLGEYIGQMVGSSPYSGQSISYWENNQTQIHKDHRQVLTALIKVLYEYGGLQNLAEANELLAAGNYRPLNDQEHKFVFGKERVRKPTGPHSTEKPFWTSQLLEKLGRLFDQTTPARVFKALIISLLVVAAWLGIAPLLKWPVMSQQSLLQSLIGYIVTSMVLPIFISILAHDQESALPADVSRINRFLLQLIGSAMGFHLGFLSIFSLLLISYHLHLYPWPRALLLTAHIWPVVLSFASARQVPVNQYLAYGRIHFHDFALMLIALPFPALISGYFYVAHHWLLSAVYGPITLFFGLAALGMLLLVKTRKNTTPPS